MVSISVDEASVGRGFQILVNYFIQIELLNSAKCHKGEVIVESSLSLPAISNLLADPAGSLLSSLSSVSPS